MKKQFLILILFINTGMAFTQDLTVMTYNIRLDYSSTGDNLWSDRKTNMVNQLLFYEPDVLGIQEGLPHQVRYLDENLVAYEYIGVGRDDGNSKGEFCAIYYKTSALELLRSGTFWLSPTPDIPSKGWDAAFPRICTFGLFETIGSEKKFWIFNTHFDHKGEEARRNAMDLILTRIKEYNSEHFPLILMGDLNAEPEEEPIQKMEKVLFDSHDVARLVFGPDATFNAFNFEEAPSRRIDYIAVDDQLIVEKYAVLTDSYQQHYISDHFPVFCSLSFKD